MSATNQTENYGLPQFVGADKPSWLGDFNSAMGEIDAQMKTNADDIASEDTDLGLTEDKASTALNKVTSLEDKFNLSYYQTKQGSELFTSPSLTTEGNFKLAQDSDGSIFKFYNAVILTNSSESSVSISLVPIPGFEGLYGKKVFNLSQVPQEAYAVNAGGLYIYKTQGALSNVNTANFFVGSDGGVYILGNTTSSWGIPAGQTFQISFTPCVYFNANFGD